MSSEQVANCKMNWLENTTLPGTWFIDDRDLAVWLYKTNGKYYFYYLLMNIFDWLCFVHMSGEILVCRGLAAAPA